MVAKPPSSGIKDILVAQSLGVAAATTGWAIRISKMSSSPATQIMIADTGGMNVNPAWLYEEKTLQVLVRGAPDGYEAAWQKAKDIKDALVGIDPHDRDGDRWDGITMLGDLAFLQYDEQDRPIFTMNFRLLLEPSAANSPLTHRESL
jgi:hypothetical protein